MKEQTQERTNTWKQTSQELPGGFAPQYVYINSISSYWESARAFLYIINNTLIAVKSRAKFYPLMSKDGSHWSQQELHVHKSM